MFAIKKVAFTPLVAIGGLYCNFATFRVFAKVAIGGNNFCGGVGTKLLIYIYIFYFLFFYYLYCNFATLLPRETSLLGISKNYVGFVRSSPSGICFPEAAIKKVAMVAKLQYPLQTACLLGFVLQPTQKPKSCNGSNTVAKP